jgi:ribulose kinase
MAYALGLDFGTSGARAAAVDRQGQLVAQAQVRFTTRP